MADEQSSRLGACHMEHHLAHTVTAVLMPALLFAAAGEREVFNGDQEGYGGLCSCSVVDKSGEGRSGQREKLGFC